MLIKTCNQIIKKERKTRTSLIREATQNSPRKNMSNIKALNSIYSKYLELNNKKKMTENVCLCVQCGVFSYTIKSKRM